MNVEQKYKYIRFYLTLFRGFFVNKQMIINGIIKHGIYRYSQHIEATEYRVATQIIYHYYNKGLTDQIKRELKKVKFEYLGLCDYRGFSDPDDRRNFEPSEEEVNEVIEALKGNLKLYELGVEFYRVCAAYHSLGITGPQNQCIEYCHRQKEDYKGDAEAFIKKELLFQVRDEMHNEFDHVQFAAFMAIRSIVGEKLFCKTNKKHVFARMLGYKSFNELPYGAITELERDLINKYDNRYHWRKLTQALELNWHVRIYGTHTRGFYVGIGDTSLYSQMAKQKAKKKAKLISIQQAKKEATMQNKVSEYSTP